MPEIDPLSHQKPGDIKNTNSEIVPFRDAVFVWLKIGLLSFGGPAGQIALMHRVLVEEEGWIEERRFLHALNFCMVLPGPEAQQLAIYIGWLMHGTRGGLVAGILFVLPGALVILLLSVLYAAYREFAIVTALFFGIKAAVLAVVIEALIRIGQKALRSEFLMAIAMLAFIGIAVFDVSFPFIILAAAVAGYVAGKVVPLWLAPREASSSLPKNAPTDRVRVKLTGEPAVGKTIRLSLTCLALWLLPTASLALWLGWQNVFVEEGIFFSKMAVVTFGGAYAVLAYVAQQAVDVHQWLEPGEMLDGLGLAETTPGPLILVVQFVGFAGAYRNPGMLDPLLAGTLGALLTTWVTFVPCFLWIFLGAPYVERLRGIKALDAALSAITAAIVGVILNLALWFGMHILFSRVTVHQFAGIPIEFPVVSSVEPVALLLTMAALIAMRRFKVSMLLTLACSALVGTLTQLSS